jgi:2-dehydro-3-deoxyphosphogluconate aldolase/(4S)-4-hydroxy-2-oxoglutarate aldolase
LSSSIKQILQQARVIPVVVIEQIEDAVPLATALVNGGLNVLEITLRTPVAIKAITEMKQALPQTIIGSGTVIDIETMQASLDAGVDFMVSPGTNAELLEAVAQNSAPLLPGAATPSEVMNLLNKGFDALKFFPAVAAGGVNMLKSIGGPLPQVTFCPTGGINLNNAPEFLALPNVACVGGTWMLDKKLIADKNWSEITRLAEQASNL